MTMQLIDPNAEYWVCWRIEGDLCGRSLAPANVAIAAETAQKVAKVWPDCWLELARERAASPAAMGHKRD